MISPTQPLTSRRPEGGQTIKNDHDFTPELRAEAEEIVALVSARPDVTPSAGKADVRCMPTMGAQAAATNRPGGSHDPETPPFTSPADVHRH
jgi:hypothetical protein